MTQSDVKTGITIVESPVEVVREVVSVENLLGTGDDAAASASVAAARRRYEDQIARRHKMLDVYGQFDACHTVLLGSRSNFRGSAVVELSRAVDAVVTRFWSAGADGPRLASSFRLYRASYDPDKNVVRYGAENILAKDGTDGPPRRGARGGHFDPLAVPVNLETFFVMDAEWEACARDRSLLTGRPPLACALLCYAPGELTSDILDSRELAGEILPALHEDVVAALTPGAPTPSWACSPGGRLTEIMRGDVESSDDMIIYFIFGKEAIAVPAYAARRVSLGVALPPGAPMADPRLPALASDQSWDTLVKSVGPELAQWLVRKTWSSAILRLEDRRTMVPGRYLPRSVAANNVGVYRDMRGLLGRSYHDPKKPQVVRGFEDFEAAISCWYLEGPPSKENLSFSGPGYEADFHGLNELWADHYDPTSTRKRRRC